VKRRQAALALLMAVAAVGCGDDDKPTPVDARALTAAGLAAVGADGAHVDFEAERRGTLLTLRASKAPRGEGLLTVLPMFERVHAPIKPFCPPPGILRCRPALRASATVRDARAPEGLTAALRKLVARTYAQQPLVRRHGRETRIVTANGELLAAVRTQGRVVLMSFGGAAPPLRPTRSGAGRLVVEAGPDTLALLRASLPRRASEALQGVRRLVVVMPLPG
jgi:hypothetical protein